MFLSVLKRLEAALYENNPGDMFGGLFPRLQAQKLKLYWYFHQNFVKIWYFLMKKRWF